MKSELPINPATIQTLIAGVRPALPMRAGATIDVGDPWKTGQFQEIRKDAANRLISCNMPDPRRQFRLAKHAAKHANLAKLTNLGNPTRPFFTD